MKANSSAIKMDIKNRLMAHKVKAVTYTVAAISLLCGGQYLRAEVAIPIEKKGDAPSVVFMPRKDALLIEYFLRRLLVFEPFAYTLSGLKPISLSYYEHPFTSFFSLSPSNILFSCGWDQWKKYEPYFHSSRFLLWSEENAEYTTIFLADKNLCKETLEHHASLFEETLGKKYTVNDLLQFKQSFVDESLKSHSGLLGILLGFGKGNAWLYYERHQKCYCSGADQVEKAPPLQLICKPESDGREWIRWFLPRSLHSSDIRLPSFVGDPHSEESQGLKAKYLSGRERLIEYYKEKDFLSASLSLFINGPTIPTDRSS